jgi:hypothetical protein
MAEQSYTLEQSRQQAARLLADATENHAAACRRVEETQARLAEARADRDAWAAEVRRLTPRTKRTRKVGKEGGGDSE